MYLARLFLVSFSPCETTRVYRKNTSDRFVIVSTNVSRDVAFLRALRSTPCTRYDGNAIRRSSRITRSRVSQERQFLRKPTERRAKKQVNYAKHDEFLGNRKLNGDFRVLRVAACETRDCSTHAWKRAS